MNTLTVTNQVLALARKNHWWFRILGVERPIFEPVYKNGWWFIPKEQDKSIIPSNAIRRVEELLKAGVPIARVIVAHEAPKVLPSPYVQPQPITIPWKELGRGFGVAISVVGGIIATVFISVIPILLMMPMALIDPALIVQLPDGTMVEVMRWVD